jgi:hypothetical protein
MSSVETVLPWSVVSAAARELLPGTTVDQGLKWMRSAWVLLPPSLNPRARLGSDRAESLIALVALALLCESCHWVQHFDEVESPLPSILDAMSKLELTPTQFRALIGVQDDTPEADEELPWLIYDEALKRHRHLLRLFVNAYPTDLELARWFLNFSRPHGDDDELLSIDESSVMSWCADGCEISV